MVSALPLTTSDMPRVEINDSIVGNLLAGLLGGVRITMLGNRPESLLSPEMPIGKH